MWSRKLAKWNKTINLNLEIHMKTRHTSPTAKALKLETQKRRTLVAALASLLFIGTGIFLSQEAHAQNYPTRPVKIVVPFATGGPADNYARFMAQRLQDSLGQTFVLCHWHRLGRQSSTRWLHPAVDVQHANRQ
jgi:hypothetical protein